MSKNLQFSTFFCSFFICYKINVKIAGGSGLPNTSVRIYYAWGTSSQSCSSMSKYVTITPSSGATSATANVTIYTSSISGYGTLSGKIYICNKNAAIKDRANNSLAQSNLTSANMYLNNPIAYPNGQIVYFNPTTDSKCTDYTESQSNTGVKSGCMKWYAYNDSLDATKVNLLLDHNTTALVAFNSDGLKDEPKQVLTSLTNDTSNWNNSLNTRLITAEEIMQIVTGVSKLPDGIYHIDEYGWIYDRTSKDCKSYGCFNNSDMYTYGYWTTTPSGGKKVIVVGYDGSLNSAEVDIYARFGVRPVIEVSKSKLY